MIMQHMITALLKSWMQRSAIESLNGKGQVYIDKVDKWEEAILSYFGRFNYNYKSKYMAELNARYDGSSKFLPENRWNFFWEHLLDGESVRKALWKVFMTT